MKFSIQDCSHLYKMLHALKYYTLLNLDNNPSNHYIFMNFCENVYKNILHDYQHIITVHSNQLEQIHAQIIVNRNFDDCDHSKCVLFKRYYDNSRRRTQTKQSSDVEDEKKIDDKKLLFYSEIFDNIHHWLFHLYQVGMRTTQSVINGDIKQNDDNEDINYADDSYIDQEFSRIKKHIDEQRKTLKVGRDRFGDDQSNKFQMQIDENNGDTELVTNDATPFIDALSKQLQIANITTNTMDVFIEYLKLEDFDSDGLIVDIMNYQQGSNIINNVNDEEFKVFIIEYMEEFRSMSYLCPLFIYIALYTQTLL